MTEFLAFSAEQVGWLTGLSRRQLAYWERAGFFLPHYAGDNRRSPYSRAYSFRDLVGLRTIALLRNTHRIPLQELRAVARWLAEHPTDSWSSLTFYVSGRRVFFDDPETGARLAARPLRQSALPIHMEQILRETHGAAARLCERTPQSIGKIERHRYIARNEPVLAGTRVPTGAIWNLHEAGYDTGAIIREYPRLTSEDVRAALDYEKEQHRRRAG